MNIFGKKQDSATIKEKSTVYKKADMYLLIQQIHNEFYTEVDKLLEQANIKKPVKTEKQAVLDKAERLKKLGFSGTIVVQEAQKEEATLSKIKAENLKKESLIEAITYFSNKYPLYKFITEDSVKKICEKYNLIYGEVGNYIGEVPEKNLQQIEQFKIDKEDCCYSITSKYSSMYLEQKINANYKQLIGTFPDFDKYGISSEYINDCLTEGQRTPLEIVAPFNDFNTSNMKLENFKLVKSIEIPDPVVLQPVLYKNVKYFLIITAWGEEASDELVVNSIMN